MPNFIDLSGRRFGKLSVIHRASNRAKIVFWLCLCDCGNSSIVSRSCLTSGNTKSCGCYRRDWAEANVVQHGHNRKHRRSTEYGTWIAMRQRCLDKNNKSFKNYGGRGIKVCSEWANDFKNFFRDMGPRPKGMTLERKDSNGPYSLENCVWASWKSQQRNRTNNHLITLNGETLTVSAWVERGISPVSAFTVYHRIHDGWPKLKALLTPKTR